MLIQRLVLDPVNGTSILVGDGLPTGYQAPIGSLWVNRSGGSGTTLYTQYSSSLTHWLAVGSGSGGGGSLPTGLLSSSIQINALSNVSASFATNALTANSATTATTATTVTSASFATNALTANTATSVTSASFASNALTANTATSVSSASFANNALTANSSTSAFSATSAGTAVSASYAPTNTVVSTSPASGGGTTNQIWLQY